MSSPVTSTLIEGPASTLKDMADDTLNRFGLLQTRTEQAKRETGPQGSIHKSAHVRSLSLFSALQKLPTKGPTKCSPLRCPRKCPHPLKWSDFTCGLFSHVLFLAHCCRLHTPSLKPTKTAAPKDPNSSVQESHKDEQATNALFLDVAANFALGGFYHGQIDCGQRSQPNHPLKECDWQGQLRRYWWRLRWLLTFACVALKKTSVFFDRRCTPLSNQLDLKTIANKFLQSCISDGPCRNTWRPQNQPALFGWPWQTKLEVKAVKHGICIS